MALLPTQLNQPSTNFSDYIGFLAGEKKVGKTSFCAEFEDHLILEMEVGNARHLECRYVDIPNLKILNATLKELENKPAYAKTIIVDEVQLIYDLVCENVLEREGANDLSELSWARGWNECKRRTDAYFRRIQSIGAGVIYTGHTLVKTTNNRNNKEIATMEVNCKKAINELLERYTQWWGCMLFEEDTSRYIQIVGDGFVKASNGFTNSFKYIQGGKIPLGTNPKQAYENFMKAFRNEPIVDTNVNVAGKIQVGTKSNAKITGLRTS